MMRNSKVYIKLRRNTKEFDKEQKWGQEGLQKMSLEVDRKKGKMEKWFICFWRLWENDEFGRKILWSF